MQNKGAIKFLASILAIACLYQLSFTIVTTNVEREAREIAAGNNLVEAAYLDSMKNEVVYNLGFIDYTYGETKEREMNLGLDLRGGMNVTLQISVKDVVIALARDAKDVKFNEALELATLNEKSSNNDYIVLFKESFEELYPTVKLSDYFDIDNVTSSSTNDEVAAVLRANAETSIESFYNVLDERINKFGVTQPNIQKLNKDRILVELPGVKDPERVRKLLQGTASLTFWAVYNNTEVQPMLQRANARLAEINAELAPEVEVTDVIVKEKVVADKKDDATNKLLEDITVTEAVDSTEMINQYMVSNPLFALINPVLDQMGGVAPSSFVGYVQARDTAAVSKIFAMPQISRMFPRTLTFMWGMKAIDETSNVFQLYAVNTMETSNTVDGSAITSARADYSQFGSTAEVSMTMNAEGAAKWARLTGDNINKSIAVVLDGYVCSAPNVDNQIAGGQSRITGDFTIVEATDLANALNSGKLPVPATIVQETVVGPSLGKESIDAGIFSFMLAFVLVLLYMMFFYSTAGLMASIALVANLFFLLGILASFGAVLTLPGIAGIVLTMGMAVDANVIIYERIKEELVAGKLLAQAIKDGFNSAYSAILDGNATTFITGIVLFFLGSGPVKGFATTLIVGIITSLFCSIFITRLLLSMKTSNGKGISFSNKLTRSFLKNIHFDFIGKRKIAYIISSIMILICVVSLSTRKLSIGVEFSGGRSYVVRFDQDVRANDVRGALSDNDAFSSGVEVKQFGDDNQMRITTQYKYDTEGQEVSDEIINLLHQELGELYATPISYEGFSTNNSENGIISYDSVDSSIAADITLRSIIAVLISLIAIGLYIVLRFSGWAWALGGVASLLHDALITIGIFSLLWGILPFDLDINQAFIAAILTIIGYSINDTVVIFDRIRENNTLFPKRTLKDNVNSAINSTLARTLNTAGSTLVVLIAIFIFGGEVIRGFIFALAFGVVIGTYSSVYIATPIAYDYIMRKAKKK